MAFLGKTPIIENLVLTDANTEYSYLLPNGTKKFSIQCRTDKEMKVAFVENESGSKYITIPEGASFPEDGLNTSELTVYLQAPHAGVIAEILSWTT